MFEYTNVAGDLVLEQGQFTEYDAHYFPEKGLSITRLSEQKNYSDSKEPSDTTVICAELPTSPDSFEWTMDDEQLGNLLQNDLEKAEGRIA